MSSSSSSPSWDSIPILHASRQVVLYNPTSHALSIRERDVSDLKSSSKPLICPYCERPYDVEASNGHPGNAAEGSESRAHNYFHLLAIANESSRPQTPQGTPERSIPSIGSETMAEGYYSAFFKEERRLGMGANGSVFLCQHILDGNPLGLFAVKKVAVGQSHGYLLNCLREVRLLETLRHPNIINYHHSWLETHQFSSFGPSVPTLFILMQLADGGSLDTFIRARLGDQFQQLPDNCEISSAEEEPHSRSARIRAFKSARANPEEKRARRSEQRKAEHSRAVHLLGAEEVKEIFDGVVSGLGFLHSRSILHLDLKPGNILLTWDDGRLIPRAMLSDFGTYQDMIRPERVRTGVTGTLEYSSPESLSLSHQPSSKADIWSLGMILHMLLFFRLPYDHVEDSDISKLENEVRTYGGFKSTPDVAAACKRRGLPRAVLMLLEQLLTVIPRLRPSCEQILTVLSAGKLDPLRYRRPDEDRESLVPTVRTRQDSTHPPVVARTSSDDTVRVQRNSDPNAGEADAGLSSEKIRLLSLPPPTAPTSRLLSRLYSVSSEFLRSFWRLHPVRIVKSAILIIKVVSLTNLCGDILPRKSVLCIVLILAVIDTWHDSMVVTLFLGVSHLGIMALGKDRCCMY